MVFNSLPDCADTHFMPSVLEEERNEVPRERIKSNKTPIPKSIGALYSASRFQGFQRNGNSQYTVQVELKHVDLTDSFLCGYLWIKGLTDGWPNLCTFFEGEIIGPKHSFLTRNRKKVKHS